MSANAPMDSDTFVDRLRAEGAARYHDRHPFHVAMHAGGLSRAQIQGWVANRFYYQTRVPIKDAVILSKSEDPAFRRAWIRRLREQDGDGEVEGGLASWLRLAAGVGLDPAKVAALTDVLPAVRFACDAYVSLVRERPLVEAVAASLTEFFSPDIMSDRLRAWEQHYRWVDPETLAYFRTRVTRARVDSQEAIAFVLAHATTRDVQERCIAALVTKCQILWAMVDAIQAAYPGDEA